MPMVFVIPAVPVETKRLAKDKSGTIPEVLELAESDGTIRRYNILVGKDGATEIALAVEATGEQKTSLHGHDGTVLRRVRVEDPGVAGAPGWLGVSNFGWNGSSLTRVLLDTQGLTRTRGFEPWRYIAPVEPTPGGGYSTLFTVPADTIAVIEVSITATANSPTIDVHLVPNAGSPGTDNAIFIGADPGVGNLPFRDGPHELHVGGTLQARNTAGAGNLGNVRGWVEYYSTGDTV